MIPLTPGSRGLLPFEVKEVWPDGLMLVNFGGVNRMLKPSELAAAQPLPAPQGEGPEPTFAELRPDASPPDTARLVEEANKRCGPLKFVLRDVRHATDAQLAQLLADALTRRVEGEGWRPIKTAPLDGTWFLAFVYPWAVCPTVLRWTGHDWDDGEGEPPEGVRREISPTHWQPLPPNPVALTPPASRSGPKINHVPSKPINLADDFEDDSWIHDSDMESR